ncbi:hypothetical protein SAMN04487950_4118 [Halogranum rubrum]|uniref:DUF7344 domain-containing protein n=1 Tax=Halogranum rubrum TaxID=553466 RepID=A0A1I4IH17_9EURY|nr:hypothetical protein [Halogranum rubrum]SFL53584.1 hypothetical protein SAMN04487950_4118 [Halogranum rubrum]
MNATQSTRASPTSAEASGDDVAQFEPLSKDKLFHILQNQRRRYALRYLQGTEEVVDMRDVAEQVAAWEHDTTVQQLTSNQRQRAYISLYQCHLPKLDEEGIIDYNQQRGFVERTPLADQLDPYLEATGSTEKDAEESEDDTELSAREGRQMGVSEWMTIGGVAVAALLSALTALDVSVFAGIPDLAVAGVVLCLCSFLTLKLPRSLTQSVR